jgi:hypothetical protein
VTSLASLADNALAEALALRQIERRRLEDDLKAAKADCDEMGEELLRRWMETGVSSVKAHGMTLYIHSQLWAGVERAEGEATGAAYARAAAALEASGLGDFVEQRFNVHSLSAHFRELADAKAWTEVGELLPAELRGAIKLSEVYQVRSRKAG